MKKNPPWTKIRSRTVFKNPYVIVNEDVVRRPDGSRGVYAYMAHPGGVGVVAVDKEQRVYLVREYKYPMRAYGLHLVSGGIEPRETRLQAAKREFKEETGGQAQHWISLGKVHASDGFSEEIGHLFLAEGLRFGKREILPLEPLTIVRLPLKKAVQMVIDGRITCSYAVTGLIRAAVKIGVVKV